MMSVRGSSIIDHRIQLSLRVMKGISINKFEIKILHYGILEKEILLNDAKTVTFCIASDDATSKGLGAAGRCS